jgi:hypothetical protein
VRAARPTVGRLRTTATKSEEPFRNLRYVLEHLDGPRQRRRAVAREPTGRGFTGLEAFLRYAFVQSQAINLFDARGYVLKANALVNECSPYTDAASRLADPGRTERCKADLGPGGRFEPAPVTRRLATARRTAAPQPAPAGRTDGRTLELPGLPPIALPREDDGAATDALLDLLLR